MTSPGPFLDTAVVGVIDEVADGGLERAKQIVVLEQYPVLQGLVPTLDLALHLRMVRRAPDTFHALEPGDCRKCLRDAWSR